MAELIDLLFIFWFVVTIGVYILGSIYENHLKEKSKADLKRQKRLESTSRVDDWRPFASSTNNNSTNYNDRNSQNDSSHQYDRNNNQPQQQQQQQQQFQSATYSSYRSPYEDLKSSRQNESPYSRTSQQDLLSRSSSGIRQTDFSHYDASSGFYGGHKAPNDQQQQQQQQSNYGHKQTTLSSNDSIPTATGFNSNCVDWVNQILYLFYSKPDKYGPIIAENIYRSLNEKLSNIVSSSVDYSDLVIEFRSIDLNSSSKPELKNVRTESESDKSVSAACKIYNQRLVCDLIIQRARLSSVRGFNLTNDSLQDDSSLNYELTLENLEGKLKSVAMFNDKLIVVQFMDKPDSKISLRLKNHPTPSVRQLVNEDALVSLILQALTQVVVDLYFGDDHEFPQYPSKQHQSGYRNKLNILKGSASEIKRQFKHDFFGALSSSSDGKERKIFVKLLRAKNINYNQNVTCIMEVDNPKQSAISSTKAGSNPFWDEHFLFLINEKTSNELTFELWDSLDQGLKQRQHELIASANNSKKTSSKAAQSLEKFNKNELTASGKFLGFARLSIEELRRNPVQKQTLMLQSRGETTASEQTRSNLIGGVDLSDSIGGELQLELVFLEHSNSSINQAPIQKSNSANSISSMAAAAAGDQGDIVSIDRKLTPSGFLITTTTITKPASQKVQSSKADRLSAALIRNHSPISSATEQSGLELSVDGFSTQLSNRSDQANQPYDGQNEDEANSRAGSRLSRSRSRSRGFLRAIKRRFSFSRNRRSRSVSEAGGGGGGGSGFYSRAESQSPMGQQHNMDAISIESRSRASSEVSMSGRAKSVPATRDSNEVPTIVINKSRLSDASSAFTFTHPKSQLVIECSEPKMSIDGSSKERTLLRHYAIPDDPASERRWRKRGIKLHLFNEHQFVACHLAGSSTCHLCGRVFSRRPGKQGYKCRNCHLLSHKQCHVKVDHNCPYATKDGLKLEFIDADPPASLVLEKGHSTSSLSRQQQQQQPQQRHGRPNSRLATKSMSVEVDDR